MASGTASAAGWNHDYTDPSGDVSYANIDITEIKSHASGTDIIIELTVLGVIENTSGITYHIEVFGEPEHGSVWYGNTGMPVVTYPDGGVNMTGATVVGGNTVRGIIPITHAGNASAFDIQGQTVRVIPSGNEHDIAYNIASGPDDTAWQILGMAAWLFILVLLAPIIVIVAVVVIVLYMKRKAQSPPPMQQPPPPL
jgi:hypothetical protein